MSQLDGLTGAAVRLVRSPVKHPEAIIAVIDEIVRSEHEAITVDRLFVLPTTVIDGAEERLAEESRQTLS